MHRKQVNTWLLVENSICKLITCTKLEHSTLSLHSGWKYSFPCNLKFCAGLGSSSHLTDLAGGRSCCICTAQQDFFNTCFSVSWPWPCLDQSSTRTGLRSELTLLSTWTCSIQMVSISSFKMGNRTKLRLANSKWPDLTWSGLPVQVNDLKRNISFRICNDI